MLFRQGDYSDLEYKQRFKEQIEVLEAYNGGFLLGNSPGATAQEIATLGLDAEIEGDMEKARVLARGKYMGTTFLLSSDRRRYGKLILFLKKEYTKQQKNYPKTLTYIYGLMVAFKLTRHTPVFVGWNKGMNFGNVVVKPRTRGNRDHGVSRGTVRKIECWRCSGDHMKRDCPKRAKYKENKKKDKEDAKN